MSLSKNIPGLSEKAARELAKRIAKESDGIRVKFGTTNGKRVLHVIAPGNGGENHNDGVGSRTIRTEGEWEVHPSNKRIKRNEALAETEPTEKLMEANGG